MEKFNKIKGYENYSVSNQGRVYNYKKRIFLKPQKNTHRYLHVGLWKNGIGKMHTIHRLVALAFIPNVFGKRTINHIDGCKANNHVSNLEWNTHSENVKHAFDNGLKNPTKGSKNGKSKLTENQVLEIRRLYSTGEYTQRALGKIFGVTPQLIELIINRKIWRHI